MPIYGIINKDNILIDISKSKKYTKRYATIHGYNKIGCRNVNSYNAVTICEKIGNKWIDLP